MHALVCTNSGSCRLWLSQKRRQERGRPPCGRNSWRHLNKVNKKEKRWGEDDKTQAAYYTHSHRHIQKHILLAHLGLSCPPSIYICQNLMYPSWLAVANTVPSGDKAPSLTRWKDTHIKQHKSVSASNLSTLYFLVVAVSLFSYQSIFHSSESCCSSARALMGIVYWPNTFLV